MSLYSQFATDTNQEKDGIFLQYGTNSKGLPVRIKIARAGGSNARFAKILERETKPYRRQIQMETLDEETGQIIQRRVYAKAVILGWENVEDKAGVAIPFTEENVIKVLTDLPDLFIDIRECAAKAALFRSDALESDAKNLPKS
jgi:hypothetical protein